jgi:hydroxyacylglutathione hydrolase
MNILNRMVRSLAPVIPIPPADNFLYEMTVAFSAHVDPGNPDIKKLVAYANNNEVTTGKFTIGDEKNMNVFMRLQSAAVLGASSHSSIL